MSSPNSPADTPFTPVTPPTPPASADPETGPSPLVTNAETNIPTVPVAVLRDVTKVYRKKAHELRRCAGST